MAAGILCLLETQPLRLPFQAPSYRRVLLRSSFPWASSGSLMAPGLATQLHVACAARKICAPNLGSQAVGDPFPFEGRAPNFGIPSLRDQEVEPLQAQHPGIQSSFVCGRPNGLPGPRPRPKIDQMVPS